MNNLITTSTLKVMKKCKAYICFITMDALGQVLKAYDGCPPGIDGHCNHVAATLFALEEYFKHQSKRTDAMSCTSKPCQWNNPHQCKVDNLAISKCKFKKHEDGKAKIEKTPPLKEPTLPWPASVKHDSLLTNTKFCNHLHMVKETDQNRPKNWF